MKNIKYILLSLIAIVTLSSCDDFLSEAPSKSTSLVPSTTEQLDYILNSYAKFYQEGARAAYMGSDAFGLLTEMTDVSASMPGIAVVQFAAWDIDNLPTNSREGYFSGEYSKIFYANMVLSYLSKVSGSDADKLRIEREAKFIRAYSLWNLAQTYCLPYTEANKGEVGMTIKASTSFEEFSGRATLEETYAQIEADLTVALEITDNMTIVNNKYKSWRANKAAVNGFAARYWLNRNDYDKAYQYATAALQSHNVFVDYNTDMRYSNNPSYATVNGEKIPVLYPYTHDNQIDMTDMMEWKEFMYFRMMYNESWWYIPSKELIALYDHQYDLRYVYHFVDNYSYSRGITTWEYPGYIFFYKDRIPSGPTTAEMTLIRAECLARQNKVSEAMAEVNKLREMRMASDAPASVKYLSASTKDMAIKLIIEEREREMPFTERWYDIRRLNNNEDSNDDIGDLTRYYYPYNSAGVLTGESPVTYKLTKNSRRYAAPIPQTDIDASNGVIVQNKY